MCVTAYMCVYVCIQGRRTADQENLTFTSFCSPARFLKPFVQKDEVPPLGDFLSLGNRAGLGHRLSLPRQSWSQVLESLMLSQHRLSHPTQPGWGTPAHRGRQTKLSPWSFTGFARFVRTTRLPTEPAPESRCSRRIKEERATHRLKASQHGLFHFSWNELSTLSAAGAIGSQIRERRTKKPQS